MLVRSPDGSSRLAWNAGAAAISRPAHSAGSLGIRAKLLSEGGAKMWAEFMDELRETHLGLKKRKKPGPSVGERLQAAYEQVVNRK